MRQGCLAPRLKTKTSPFRFSMHIYYADLQVIMSCSGKSVDVIVGKI